MYDVPKPQVPPPRIKPLLNATKHHVEDMNNMIGLSQPQPQNVHQSLAINENQAQNNNSQSEAKVANEPKTDQSELVEYSQPVTR